MKFYDRKATYAHQSCTTKAQCYSTRGSAIAERPRCRVGYSFRQK